MGRKPITRDKAVELVKDPGNWEVFEESAIGKVRMLALRWNDEVYVKVQVRAAKNCYNAWKPNYVPSIYWRDIGSIYEWDQEHGLCGGGISQTELANHIYMTDRAD